MVSDAVVGYRELFVKEKAYMDYNVTNEAFVGYLLSKVELDKEDLEAGVSANSLAIKNLAKRLNTKTVLLTVMGLASTYVLGSLIYNQQNTIEDLRCEVNRLERKMDMAREG